MIDELKDPQFIEATDKLTKQLGTFFGATYGTLAGLAYWKSGIFHHYGPDDDEKERAAKAFKEQFGINIQKLYFIFGSDWKHAEDLLNDSNELRKVESDLLKGSE